MKSKQNTKLYPVYHSSLFQSFFILILFLALANGSVYAQDVFVDTNSDGIANNPSAVVPPSSNQFATVNDCVRIGLIESGTYTNIKNRLEGIGYTNVSILSPNSDLSILKQYDIIYLPTGWANGNVGSGDFDVIEQYSFDYLTFVAEGGGLFLEQPNPILQTNDMATPSVLPYPITFDSGYDSNDHPPIIVNPNHEIVVGISPEEMSFPADLMISVDENYEILVMGSVTMSPSLVVTEYGQGKILVSAANPSITAFYPMSDEFYTRMVEWLGPARYTEVITSCGAYTWIDGNVYTSNNNTANFTLLDIYGCDSLVQLDLTIEEPDLTILEDGFTLTVSESIGTYQWLDCNNDYAPILNATQQSYTASENGSYAVVVTLNVCTDTSVCTSVGMSRVEDVLLEKVSVYPNPSNGQLTINFGLIEKPNVKVYTALGQLLFEKQAIPDDVFEFEFSDVAGVYFIEILVDSDRKIFRVVRE